MQFGGFLIRKLGSLLNVWVTIMYYGFAEYFTSQL